MKIIKNIPGAFIFMCISFVASLGFVFIAIGILFYAPSGMFGILIEESTKEGIDE